MKLDNKALLDLVHIINESPIYRSGSDLVNLFNEFGFRDVYGRGFPSRKGFTYEKLTVLNETKKLEEFINHIVNSRHYIFMDDYDEVLNGVGKHVSKIIQYCGYELVPNETGEFIVAGEGLLEDEAIEIKSSFESIQDDILIEIDKAKFAIWVAVAWFTNAALLNALNEKARAGVNVQVIVNADDINGRVAVDELIEIHYIPSFGMYNNIHHNKFCVIDLKTTINGSFNWTTKANYNKENITIIHNREQAEVFAAKFIELKSQ